MLTIIIRPCLLGFDVSTHRGEGNGFIRHQGIFSHFGEIVDKLIHTEEDFKVVLR
jgi:hypothetical protein